MTLFSSATTIAQTMNSKDTQFYWNKIREADAKTKAVEVKWESVLTRIPETSLTDQKIEELVANVVSEGVQLGVLNSPAAKKQSADSYRKHLQIERKGSSQTSHLHFVHVGKQTRGDTVFETPQYVGSTDDQNWRSHTIDFYDWQSSVVLDQVFDVGEDGTVLKSSSWTGERLHAPKRALSRSAGTFAQRFFLTGQSVLASYDPSKTVIVEGENDTIVLEMTDVIDENQLHRTTISKKMWKPLSSETVLKGDEFVGLRIEATGYKQYSNGVWFPTELIETMGDVQTIRFKLKDVKFNDDVDPAGLLLPAGANLRDERFGEVTSYKIADGTLPTDAEVRKMLGEQRKQDTAMAKAQGMDGNGNRQLSLMIAPIAGLFLMALSCALWVRSGRKE